LNIFIFCFAPRQYFSARLCCKEPDAMTPDPQSMMDQASPASKPLTMTSLRRYAFFALAAFILLGPAPGQLFDKRSPWLREWVMYSGVGVGLPKGVFTVHDASGPVADYTPLQAAGLERYPLIVHYFFDKRIFEDADLTRYAAGLCEGLLPGQHLSFDGVVGTRKGWVPMPVTNLCAQTEDAP